MTYAQGRVFYDADSQIMELPDFLTEYADPDMRERLPKISYAPVGRSYGGLEEAVDAIENGPLAAMLRQVDGIAEVAPEDARILGGIAGRLGAHLTRRDLPRAAGVAPERHLEEPGQRRHRHLLDGQRH